MRIYRKSENIFTCSFDTAAMIINFIREPEEDGGALLHVCRRTVAQGKIAFVTNPIYWDYTEGRYWCSRCQEELDPQDVMSDGQGTGQEGHC